MREKFTLPHTFERSLQSLKFLHPKERIAFIKKHLLDASTSVESKLRALASIFSTRNIFLKVASNTLRRGRELINPLQSFESPQLQTVEP